MSRRNRMCIDPQTCFHRREMTRWEERRLKAYIRLRLMENKTLSVGGQTLIKKAVMLNLKWIN